MVDAPVSHVVLIHHIHHIHDDIRVVGSVAVYLHIEDMTTTGEVVIRSLHLCFMKRGALIVNRHMVGMMVG